MSDMTKGKPATGEMQQVAKIAAGKGGPQSAGGMNKPTAAPKSYGHAAGPEMKGAVKAS